MAAAGGRSWPLSERKPEFSPADPPRRRRRRGRRGKPPPPPLPAPPVGGERWGSPEREGSPGRRWGPPEEEEGRNGGGAWGAHDVDERPPLEAGGSREGSWVGRERRSPLRREGGPWRGPPSHGGSPPPLGREAWGSPRGRWGGSPGLEGSPPGSHAKWESPQGRRGGSPPMKRVRRDGWESPQERRRERLRKESPPRRRRGSPLWGSREGRGREPALPSRRQGGRGSPERVRREPREGWREGSRGRSHPTWHPRPGTPMGGEGRWGGPEEVGVQPPDLPREEDGEEDRGRPGRARWPTSPTGERRDRGGPKWEGRQERSGSFRSQSPLDLERGHRVRGGGRWSSPEQRRRGPPSGSREDTPTKPSNRQQRSEGSLARSGRGWSPKGDRVETGAPGRVWREEEGPAGDAGGPDKEASPANPATSPSEWTPCQEVVNFWVRQCQGVLKKSKWKHMISAGPRPTLPNNSSKIPELNSSVAALLKSYQLRALSWTSRNWLVLQNEVLDMLGPAMTIYEMAEEALVKGEAVDTMELREWIRHLLRYIGSVNQRISLERRSHILSAINPRLKFAAAKMNNRSTDGLLFPENKVKLLEEIIQRFPQVVQPWRKTNSSVKPPYSKRRFPRRPGSHALHSAGQQHGQSPADLREEEEHR